MSSRVGYPVPGDPDYREPDTVELEATIDELLSENARLREIEAAAKLVWEKYFLGIFPIPGTPLDLLRGALEAKQ